MRNQGTVGDFSRLNWRGLGIRLVGLAWLLILPAVASGQFNYTSSEGEVTITGYTGTAAELVIPPVIDGLPVTRIGDSAFADSWSMESVIIPDSVRHLGDNAFYFSFSLTNVSLGTGVVSIGSHTFAFCHEVSSINLGPNLARVGDHAFSGCRSLSDIVIPDSVVEMGENAFSNCGLTNVTFGTGLTEIPFAAFSFCVNLPEITIPNHIERIQGAAFGGCPVLKRVTLGSGLKVIEHDVFRECFALTEISIPQSVTNIGTNAFATCRSLPAILVDPANPAYASVDGVLFSKDLTNLIQCPGGKAGRVRVPSELVSISDFAFGNCHGLTAVRFEGDAPALGLNVFHGATNLTAYYLPGAAGWGASYGGRPTAIWQPEILVADGMFGFVNGEFGFNIDWAGEFVVSVEGNDDPANPTGWSPLQAVQLIDGVGRFTDTEPPGPDGRFYQLRFQE